MAVESTTRGSQDRCSLLFSLILAITTLFIILVIILSTNAADILGLSKVNLVDFSHSWEYVWDESPVPPSSSGKWNSVERPNNPPDRNKRSYVWLRNTVPPLLGRDPAVFVYSIDTAAEVYVSGECIYRFGDFTQDDPPAFGGWPWHIIPLESNHTGEFLYVRVYSDYFDIGLWGEVLLGSRVDILKRMVKRDIPRLSIGVISLFFSGVFFALYFGANRVKSYAYLALSILPVGIRVLAYTHVLQLFSSTPLLTEYIRAGTYFLIPVGITLVIHDILENRFKAVTGIIWKLSAGYFAAALILSGFGLIKLSSTYLIFNYFFVAAASVLCVLGIVSSMKGNIEARLLTGNFIVMAGLSLYSILVTNGILPWTDEINYIIMFVFTLGLAFILIRRFVILYQNLEISSSNLGRLTDNLEAKVQERTLQLEEVNRKLERERDSLQIDSITDDLTGLFNRRYIISQLKRKMSEAKRYDQVLTILLLDLDRFKNINDSYGHLVGDQVLRTIGTILNDNLRESDVAARYGGEEFLVILPETDVDEAYMVADRIREVVSAARWENTEASVTISGGIARYADGTTEDLIRKADVLLYTAKTKGRNRIERAEGT